MYFYAYCIYRSLLNTVYININEQLLMYSLLLLFPATLFLMEFSNKLLLQGFQHSCLRAAFRNLYCRFQDLVCPYNMSLSQKLSDMFQYNC